MRVAPTCAGLPPPLRPDSLGDEQQHKGRDEKLWTKQELKKTKFILIYRRNQEVNLWVKWHRTENFQHTNEL